ncbi:hypothetical protein IFM89_027345 [Coptis chinensis]|uniref:PORR domain-containing protein n=1 Tax=Coptis chinensis TaxID=261450 RepID=A0A835HHG3_9MAGN|nr:hypothetical protein IFM89_027345 [Coptis chinensis]
MKWKKDSFFDNIETIYKSQELKPIIALKNCIVKEADKCIPISAVSKRGLELDVPIKVAKFLRQYPSIFQEFVGPEYNLPWFRLTKEAVELHNEEELVYRERREDIVDGLKRLILMSEGRKLPLKIVKGMQWYLGLPDEYLKDPEGNLDSSFSLVDMGDGLRGLSVDSGEKVLSTLQRNAVKRGVCLDDSWMPLAFPLYPSKGLRLKVKISNWLDEFQKLPYVSPYEDCSNLNRSCEVFEKRVLGVLHELLSLFVDHSAERKKILCLRTYLDLPQKFYKAFDRHPHIFYLSLRNKTCTAILKEAYDHDSAIDAHPVLNVREKYIRLMKKSDAILKTRRQKNSLSAELGKLNTDVDKDCAAGNIGEALVFDL